jgi:hypothetical protein
MNEFALIALNIMAPLLSVMVTIAAGVIAKKATTFLGLKNEKLLRDALHASAENGIKYALARGHGPGSASVIGAAVEYVKAKNPETLRKLRVSDDALKDIIRTKAQPSARSAPVQ